LPTSITILMNFHQDFFVFKSQKLASWFLKTKNPIWAKLIRVVFAVVVSIRDIQSLVW
jgi:hypothetical protein